MFSVVKTVCWLAEFLADRIFSTCPSEAEQILTRAHLPFTS